MGRGRRTRRWLRRKLGRGRQVPTPAWRQRDGHSFHWRRDCAPLSLLSQHHSTARSSPTRYDKRYEGKVLINIDPHHQPLGHGGPGDGCGVRDTSLSPSSVSVVNTLLIPSESDEDGF